MTKELEFLIKTVKDASKLITEEFEVKPKDDKGDLVTNLDYEVEQFIIESIKSEYPNFTIISEELNTNEDLTDNCFTIDPIDGTINFAHNIPLWAIQVACIKDGKTCAAVIYLPKLNELYYADKNGAFLNNKRISVDKLSLGEGVYSIEGPHKILGEFKMKNNNRNYRDFHCAALTFAFVASGRLSATNITGDKLWDFVPGEYIVEKAGGVIYNDKNMHIAANSEEFLKLMLNSSSIEDDEELAVIKKNLM